MCIMAGHTFDDSRVQCGVLRPAKSGVFRWCQRETEAKANTKQNDSGTRFV